MQVAPRSLGPRTTPVPPTRPGVSPLFRARPGSPSTRGDASAVEPDDQALPPVHPLLRPLLRAVRGVRVLRRGVAILAWTGIACPIQSVLLMLPGRGKVRFARSYWSVVCRLLGMQVRTVGRPADRPQPRRPLIYVCNHSSWIDVPVLGGRLEACFVAKEEVGGWPLVGTVARLGRTLFVSRQRKATGRERDDMRLRLGAGDDLILFPEGTSSDGSRVLPFHSSFFAAAKPNGSQEERRSEAVPLIQPVSIVYDRLGGLPVCRSTRTVFAWYGDMDLASHFGRLARWRGMRATVLLHPVLDPTAFASRKALSLAAWTAIADGAAAIRQNRIGDRIGNPAGDPAARCDHDATMNMAAHPAPPDPTEHFPLDTGSRSFA